MFIRRLKSDTHTITHLLKKSLRTAAEPSCAAESPLDNKVSFKLVAATKKSDAEAPLSL